MTENNLTADNTIFGKARQIKGVIKEFTVRSD